MRTRHVYIPKHGGAERVDLWRGVLMEDFLRAVSFRYESAATFVLKWFELEHKEAAAFLWRYVQFVYRETTLDCYLSPKPDSTLSWNGPSVARIAFERFCELMYANPALVREAIEYGQEQESSFGGTCLECRETNPAAFDRETWWEPPSDLFPNPEPLPAAVIHEYLRSQAEQRARYESERRREKEDLRRYRKQKAIKRQAEVEEKTALRCERSKQVRILRTKILALDAITVAKRMATHDDLRLKEYPIDAARIDEAVLAALSKRERETLLDKATLRWEKWWTQPRTLLAVDQTLFEEQSIASEG
jgi:hypothetical protein